MSWTPYPGESKSFHGSNYSAVLAQGLNSMCYSDLCTCTGSRSTCFCYKEEINKDECDLCLEVEFGFSLCIVCCSFSFSALTLLHVAISLFHCYSIYRHSVNAVIP